MKKNIVVYAADIGSIEKNNFGWYRKEICQENANKENDGTDIGKLVEYIKVDLKNGKKVAIGFECPLFIPITDKPEDLTKAREGENNRPWSAGAGCCSLATGLTECVWIFEKIRESNIKPTFKWKDFLSNESYFFIWEAFVTKKSKGNTHPADAKRAVDVFLENLADLEKASSVSAHKPFSLVGAGLLRAGLTNDPKILCERCIVIKS